MIGRNWMVVPLLAISVGLAGCGFGGGGPDEVVEEEVSPESQRAAPADAGPAAPPRGSDVARSSGMSVGSKFPLLKTVVQELRQPSPEGWITSRTTLELEIQVTLVDLQGSVPDGSPAPPVVQK